MHRCSKSARHLYNQPMFGAERFISLVICGAEKVLPRTSNIIILARRGLKTSPNVTHDIEAPARILRGNGGGR